MAITLLADIRRIVDDAERFLAQIEIYAQLKVRASRDVFAVAVAKMRAARQLRRRKAAKAVRLITGARFVYGPGPVAVIDRDRGIDRPQKHKGFMALKREREAKARARRLARSGVSAMSLGEAAR